MTKEETDAKLKEIMWRFPYWSNEPGSDFESSADSRLRVIEEILTLLLQERGLEVGE